MSQYAPPFVGRDCLSGDVAQLGERLVRNEEVGGSNPLISTIFIFGSARGAGC